MEESLNKIDEVKKRINVSHSSAMEALEEAQGDVLKAVVSLEEKYPDALISLTKAASKTMGNIEEGNYISVSRNGEEIIKLPVIAGALFAAVSAYKPKFFLAAAGALFLTGSDVSISLKGTEYSLRKAIRLSSEKASDSILKTRYELENRLGDLKDKNFLKEDGSGERYFIINL